MNKEIYILVGICILTFLIGHKLKQKLSNPKPKKLTKRGKKTKNNVAVSPLASRRKEKLKVIFLYIQLILVFGLLIFMIPALSRDILASNHDNYQNLILRILIVAFASYILFIGFLQLRKPPEK
ncbi:hypothetical protein BZG01_19415 [Labilibaculum manganireducens]|uniref:Uncharacterized protein n=1 Tax=Labilibaculum manganireducens TaxID=1940525 RepID=A0A2N3HTY2_9BACT|nr:hypothetical protein [Labilibaculum manganireducens]PKQ61491.1 hypothetical protein BZG01_19415 [Labilibaculum manganireducens]